MCRFVAYIGIDPVILNEILDKPANSLINQSRQAREMKQGLNADGFGIGWYDKTIDKAPGLFKSIQPAWNDFNLRYIASKIRSTCFVGHVRASTVGDVNILNCHPFIFKDFLFVHNGTIRGFPVFKRDLLNIFTDRAFSLIKGHTDSEHFFALVMDMLFQHHEIYELTAMVDAFQRALYKVQTLQQQLEGRYFTRLNSVLTDGKQMLISRYLSDLAEEPLSLYYTLLGRESLHTPPKAVLIASEVLSDYAEDWLEVPVNHLLLIDDLLHTNVQPITPRP